MRNRNWALCLVAVLALLFGTLGAAEINKGGDAQQRDIAVARLNNAGIDWVPTRDNDGAELVVRGPDGEVFRGAFSQGVPIFFDFLDRDGNPLADGTYRYELVFAPIITEEARERMYYARESGDETIMEQLRKEGLLPRERMLLSGSFTVVDGLAVDADLTEERSSSGDATGDDPGFGGIQPADFVINDDLIVDGSACIGFDCANGESFGFDTLRLKENNLRIKFDDTSIAASFPRNDWQLTANDSANGGASKFSIDDVTNGRTPFTVEANAPSHSLYVDDGGRVGLGTSTPSLELHIIDGDTPSLRLQQDGSSGFAPQTWDVAGNETNFFVRDVTNGSTLPLRIRPGAPSSSIFIDVEGDVGLGTSSPEGQLHLQFDNNTRMVFEEGTTGTESVDFIINGFNTFQLSQGNSEGRRFNLSAFDNGAGVGRRLNIGRNTGGGGAPGHILMIEGDGGVQHVWPDDSGLLRMGSTAPNVANKGGGTVVGDQASRLELKNIIKRWSDPGPALQAILDTEVYDFTYKDGRYNGEMFTGPAIVSGAEFFSKDRGKSLNEVSAVGYLIESVKALHAEIEQLKAKLRQYEPE